MNKRLRAQLAHIAAQKAPIPKVKFEDVRNYRGRYDLLYMEECSEFDIAAWNTLKEALREQQKDITVGFSKAFIDAMVSRKLLIIDEAHIANFVPAFKSQVWPAITAAMPLDKP